MEMNLDGANARPTRHLLKERLIGGVDLLEFIWWRISWMTPLALIIKGRFPSIESNDMQIVISLAQRMYSKSD
jgi:hypothetical protein